MHIKFEPVAGETKITARIEDGGLTINGKVFGYDTVPAEGPVRAQDDTITVDYGEHGGVSTCRLTGDHSVAVIAPDLPPPPPPPAPKVDLEAMAQAELENQRAGWVCDRWQIITVLGQDRWQAIEAFGANDDATWGVKAVIDYAVSIPRVSQTVDLLAHILGMSDEEVDDLFRAAMTLNA